MARRRRNTADFSARYDALVEELGCPVRTLFTIAMDDMVDPKTRVTAASRLVRQRFPTHKAVDVTHDTGDALTEFLRGVSRQRLEQDRPIGGALTQYLEGEYAEVQDE